MTRTKDIARVKIDNLACPHCKNIIGAETLKELKCEHCGKDL